MSFQDWICLSPENLVSRKLSSSLTILKLTLHGKYGPEVGIISNKQLYTKQSLCGLFTFVYKYRVCMAYAHSYVNTEFVRIG